MTKEELKQGYQPKSCNLKNIVPPSVSTNVKPKKDGYTWEDLDKAWWEGFNNAKNKMEKRIAELEKENAELKDYRLATLAKQQTGMSKYALNLEHKLSWYDDQLTKAKEILERYVPYRQITDSKAYKDLAEETEQFLNSEVEK